MIQQTKILELRTKIDKKRSRMELLEEQLKVAQNRESELVKKCSNQESARIIIQTVALQTEKNTTYHIGDIVSTALNYVFGDEIQFDCSFESKRGKTECFLRFRDADGNLTDPLSSHGGGVLDVTSFALRCAFWSLKKTRSVIILDEPLKFLSRDLIPRACDMIKMISEKLNLQIIMVSHIPEFIDIADTEHQIQKTN